MIRPVAGRILSAQKFSDAAQHSLRLLPGRNRFPRFSVFARHRRQFVLSTAYIEIQCQQQDLSVGILSLILPIRPEDHRWIRLHKGIHGCSEIIQTHLTVIISHTLHIRGQRPGPVHLHQILLYDTIEVIDSAETDITGGAPHRVHQIKKFCRFFVALLFKERREQRVKRPRFFRRHLRHIPELHSGQRFLIGPALQILLRSGKLPAVKPQPFQGAYHLFILRIFCPQHTFSSWFVFGFLLCFHADTPADFSLFSGSTRHRFCKRNMDFVPAPLWHKSPADYGAISNLPAYNHRFALA